MLLVACAAPAPSSAPASGGVAEPVLPAGAVRQPLDAARSWLRVLVFRGGRASNLGHNHVALAADLAGEIAWPDADAAQARRWRDARLALSFRLDALRLDEPAQRAALGAAFASKLDAASVAATRTNMLRSLGAEAQPQVRMTSQRIVGEGAQLAVEVEITLAGRSQRQWLAVSLDATQQRATGSAVIRQSDYGLTPFSVLGGLLAVQDEIVIEFDLSVRAAGAGS